MTQHSSSSHSTSPVKVPAGGYTIGEHILNIFKAILSAAPFTGALASLITDYIPTQRQKRVEEFTTQLAQDLDRLKTTVNSEYVLSDDFAFLFEKSFRAVAENPQKEKLDAFRAILLNSVLAKTMPEEEKEYFLSLAMSLTTLHLRVLRFLATPEQYLQAVGIGAQSVQGGFGTIFRTVFPNVQLDVAASAFGDLHQIGLINTDKGIFGTMTAGSGIPLVKGRMTKLGESFITFCTVPKT
jgi:hypothetical protein